MLNNSQIKLVQTAVRAAGIRGKGFDGRYRLLLGKYTQPNGRAVTSCKQLNQYSMEDFLAICESHGWQMPGKAATFYRDKVAAAGFGEYASDAQQAAIKNMAGDLGWNERQLGGLIKRITGGEKNLTPELSPKQAWVIIEALKKMLSRKDGKDYKDVNDVKNHYENDTEVDTCQKELEPIPF